MEKVKKERKTIASVTKAIKVMEFIAKSKEVGVTEISKELGYGVSATYHLLNTLKESNIVVQDKDTKKFRLGLKLWKLGISAYEQNDISLIVKPYLKRLRDLTGETANLTVMDNKNIVYIAQEESDRLVRMFTKTGATAPLHCTGAGKTILAFKPKEIREEILDSLVLTKFTENTIIDKHELIREMEEIRKNGYGMDKEEREVGVSCIAAPIFDLNDNVLACITISGPTARFTEENKKKWIEIILEISNQVTNEFSVID